MRINRKIFAHRVKVNCANFMDKETENYKQFKRKEAPNKEEPAEEPKESAEFKSDLFRRLSVSFDF